MSFIRRSIKPMSLTGDLLSRRLGNGDGNLEAKQIDG